jgi:nucleotide-binding universal stress UspA family protein
MYRSIIVPLDGSGFAERALSVAATIARLARAQLVLIRVHDTQPHLAFQSAEWIEFVRAAEEAYLERRAATLLAAGCGNVTWHVRNGPPALTISSCALAGTESLIVMSTHGRTGIQRSWLGSVADGVVRHSSSPVLLLRRDMGDATRNVPAFANVLVALDGSRMAEDVVQHAMRLARLFDARLLLFRVSSSSRDSGAEAYMRAIKAVCLRGAVRVDVEISHATSPADAIRARAEQLERPLIALGSHGRGLSRYLLGSVADDVLRARPPALLLLRASVSVPLTRARTTPAMAGSDAPTV